MSQLEVIAAVYTGQAFWLALEGSDDADLEGLLSAGALQYVGADAGIANRIRDHLQVTSEDCETVGLISRLSILANHELRLTYVPNPSGEIVPFKAGQLLEGWRIELVMSEGRWLVDPIRAHTADAIGVVDLKPD